MDEPRDPAANREPLLPAPRRLGDLRSRPVDKETVHTVLGRAALEVVGEFGYPELTVERIIARGGASRSAFYGAFDNADACYLAGYAEVGGNLVDGLLARCAAGPDWPRGIGAALDALAAALVARPTIARGLIPRTWSENKAAAALHEAAEARLAAAVDRGREIAPPGLTPPPSAGAFLVGAIEAAAVLALSGDDPRGFFDRVPDLTFLAVATYLGADVAHRLSGD
jgi:AcrR family transcriptional regulator